MQLIPSSVSALEEFSKSIKKYNEWFISLRNYAIAALAAFLISLAVLFELSQTQIIAISFVTIFIFIYNIQLKKLLKKDTEDFHPLRLSIFQILADLFSLSLLVYFTGGIEAPIFMFFIFHMIIGSIILPEVLMYLIAGLLIVMYLLLSLLEYFMIIPHQEIKGLFAHPFYNDLNFILGILLIFTVVLFVTIKLTSKLVADLYNREGELKNALEQLEKAEESKQKYIIAVVHELKSPIAAASSFLDLILGGFLGEINDGVKDKIAKAKARTSESIETINNILKVSKFRLLNKIEKEKVSIVDIIENIIESVTPTAERKKLELEFDTSEHNGLEINGDKTLLNLAFSNLIGNSVKYTQENGKVSIKLSNESKKIIFNISDDGIGIPKDDLKNLFREFYRASNTKDHNIEGTGTGLSVVKQVVESHNGKINVESPSKIGSAQRPGTSFTIKLPL